MAEANQECSRASLDSLPAEILGDIISFTVQPQRSFLDGTPAYRIPFPFTSLSLKLRRVNRALNARIVSQTWLFSHIRLRFNDVASARRSFERLETMLRLAGTVQLFDIELQVTVPGLELPGRGSPVDPRTKLTWDPARDSGSFLLVLITILNALKKVSQRWRSLSISIKQGTQQLSDAPFDLSYSDIFLQSTPHLVSLSLDHIVYKRPQSRYMIQTFLPDAPSLRWVELQGEFIVPQFPTVLVLDALSITKPRYAQGKPPPGFSLQDCQNLTILKLDGDLDQPTTTTWLGQVDPYMPTRSSVVLPRLHTLVIGYNPYAHYIALSHLPSMPRLREVHLLKTTRWLLDLLVTLGVFPDPIGASEEVEAERKRRMGNVTALKLRLFDKDDAHIRRWITGCCRDVRHLNLDKDTFDMAVVRWILVREAHPGGALQTLEELRADGRVIAIASVPPPREPTPPPPAPPPPPISTVMIPTQTSTTPTKKKKSKFSFLKQILKP